LKKLFLITLLLIVSSHLIYANDIIISLGDELITFNESTGKPFIDENNRTLVPLRIIMEKIGAEVGWDSESNYVLVKYDSALIGVPIDKKHIVVNGEVKETDTAAIIKEERTYIPLRAILETIGYGLEWDNQSQTIRIAEMTNGTLATKVSDESLVVEENEQVAESGLANYNGEIVFDDPALESKIRKMLNKENGKITKEDMLTITDVRIFGGIGVDPNEDSFFSEEVTAKRDDHWITSIDVLKYCENLERLELKDCKVTDLSPIKGLTNLKVIYTYAIEIESLEPLRNSNNLWFLSLRNSVISDFNVLSDLDHLSYLQIDSCGVSDIGFLSNLTNLRTLSLKYNEIQNVTPIKNLNMLEKLYLDNNPISDFSPLEELQGCDISKQSYESSATVESTVSMTILEKNSESNEEDIRDSKSTGRIKMIGSTIDNGMTCVYDGYGAFTNSMSDKGHKSGKYYFEMKLNLDRNEEPDTWTWAGLIGSDGDDNYGFKLVDTWGAGVFYPEDLKDGDIIGIAIDLNNHVGYASLNNEWKTGAPGSNNGFNLKPGLTYYAGAACSASSSGDKGEGDSWTAAFKIKDFEYMVPEEYSAFEY